MSDLPKRHPEGVFASLEGPEGAGKSSQINRLAERMRAAGREVVVTREPGGCKGAEVLRNLVLSGAVQWDPRTELMLFAAARREHVVRTIAPALARGAVVLSDRFSESSRAYQGAARGVGTALCDDLERIACDGILPDIVFLLDVDPVVGLARSKARATDSTMFEALDLEFHRTLRQAFLDRAAERPELFEVIPSMDVEATSDAVWAAFLRRFPQALPRDLCAGGR